MSRKGKNNPFFGHHHTDAFKKKMAAFHKKNRTWEAALAWRKKHGLTAEQLKRIRDAKFGKKNPNWKGDSVGYTALHRWFRRNYPPPKRCADCKKVKKLEAANKSGKYLRDPRDWEYLCRRCHMRKDGRLEKIRTKKWS